VADREGGAAVNWIRSIILVVFGLLLLLLAVRRLRRYRLKERYALLFLFLGLPFLVLAVWPAAIDTVASLLGIQYFTVMLLAISAFLILTVFELLTIVSRQDQRISTLAQLVAILQEKQKELEGRLEQSHSPATPKPVVHLQHPVRMREDMKG
jgi:hypothetical protein